MLYKILLFIHIFSAILGMGPGFVMIYIVTKSKTMSELRHSYLIRNRLHKFVMVGGLLLLITGLWMGMIQPYLFKTGWYVISIILFFVSLGFGPLVLVPKVRPIKKLLKEYQGDDIPNGYYVQSRRLFFYERIMNLLFLIIIVLMIIKPF